MAYLIANEFACYDMTEEEVLQGAILTITQKQVIQNLLAKAAEEKIHLEFDVENPNKFIQQEASLKGQIDILNYLLDASTASEEIIASQEDNNLNT